MDLDERIAGRAEDITSSQAIGRWLRLVLAATLGPVGIAYGVLLLVGPIIQFVFPTLVREQPGLLVAGAFIALLTWTNILAPCINAVDLGSLAVVLTFVQWISISLLVFLVSRRLRTWPALMVSVGIVAIVGFGLYYGLAAAGVRFEFDGP